MMEKKIVLPGEKLSDKKVLVPNTFSDEQGTYAAVIGTIDETGKYVALESRYKPNVGDIVVGIVTDSRHAGYSIDLNLPSPGFISAKELRVLLDLGSMIAAKVQDVDEVGDVSLVEIKRLPRGKVIDFPPAKIPRLIGKKSSMIELIRSHTGGDIIVGNNGYVWVSETGNIPLFLEAVDIVRRKAHTSGLTDAMSNFLKEKTR